MVVRKRQVILCICIYAMYLNVPSISSLFPVPHIPALQVICVHAAWHRKGVYEPITLLNLKQPCPDRVVRPLIFPPRVCIAEFRCCGYDSQEKRKEGRRQAKGRSSSPPPLAAGQRRLCHEGNFNLYSVQTRGKVARPGKEDAQISWDG